jgi:hypothetical protein
MHASQSVAIDHNRNTANRRMNTQATGGTEMGDENTASDAPVLSAATIARRAMLEAAVKLLDAGFTSAPALPRLLAGKEGNPDHRVVMEDLAPAVEALVERHPDLAGLRDRVQLRARYLTSTLVSIFASLPQGYGVSGVPVKEIRSSNLAVC